MFDLLMLAQATTDVASQTDPATLRIWAYVIFIGIVLGFLALDLGVFHRDAHEVTIKEATIWSIIWLTCGVAFSGLVYFAYDKHWLGLGVNTPMYTDKGIELGLVDGATAAKQYLTGYIVEKSLAMDNIFVIAIIFTYFAIPNKYQHRVLFWGIIGALVMRGAMIAVAGALVSKYMWVLIIFGLFLLVTAAKMALVEGDNDPGKNPVVKLVRKFFPVTTFFDGQRFFTKRTLAPTYSIDPKTGKEVQDPPPPGSLSLKWAITPLFLALIMVEITDLVFAVDSIPAIFAITPDPFIVFTSNIFAILGLRSLYFCLAALIAKFRFLKPALILILAFVGVKLLLLSVPPYLDVLGKWIGQTWEAQKSIKIDTTWSLGAVLVTLALAVVLSIAIPAKKKDEAASGKPA
ncbi:MAG TPA: TerC family protein [Phycisphaerales bacterium]|nr:TerC family protein [Phycisphaerales bacterium]